MTYRLILTAVLVMGVLCGLAEGSTLASFTATAASTSNTVQAGTLDISTYPAAMTMAVGDIVPGEDLISTVAMINSGTLPLRYALTATVTDPDGKAISSQLRLAVKRSVASCSPTGFDASGVVVYGPNGSFAAPGSTLNIVGNPGAFPNGGRTLTPGANEVLCIRIRLPSTVGAAYQGGATVATFATTAEQL